MSKILSFIFTAFYIHNFFQNIGEIFSALLAFNGEEIIVCNYSLRGFARFDFGC